MEGPSSARFGLSLVAAGGKLYMFGGCVGWNKLTGQDIYSAELFVLDPAASAPTWKDLTLSSSGSAPSARRFHSAAVLNNNKLLICMGQDMNAQNFVVNSKGDLARP
jgi:hypothetical protein